MASDDISHYTGTSQAKLLSKGVRRMVKRWIGHEDTVQGAGTFVPRGLLPVLVRILGTSRQLV